MALIVRIDVDRPYGKQGFARHVASRLASDYYLPRLPGLGYLEDLALILERLNTSGHRAHVFFRRCTYPSARIHALMRAGEHHYGLHLEDSRSEASFLRELHLLRQKLGFPVQEFSKHGSGHYRYGFHHHAPYEPEKYLDWTTGTGLRVFMGNLEDPTLLAEQRQEVLFYPSAFWLEPHWRDTRRFPIEWLIDEAAQRDVVMLFHPDNVLADRNIQREFEIVLEGLPSEGASARDAAKR